MWQPDALCRWRPSWRACARRQIVSAANACKTSKDQLRLARKVADVALIIPDASPVLTLARFERLDLLGSFTVPVQIVHQVYYEITRPENDPIGEVTAGRQRLHNQIDIVETNVGVGYQTRRATNPQEPSRLAAPKFWTMNEELPGSSLSDVLRKLEKGKIGHRAAMEWLNVESYDALVEIMHLSGRLMPGHQPMRVTPDTRALVRQIFWTAAQPR